jgi:hypothetical protein
MDMNQKATIKIPGLKVVVPLKAVDLPPDLVPLEGPPGEPTLELHLEGSPIIITARSPGNVS